MKAEKTKANPKLNLLRPEAQQEQSESSVITKVFMTNGMEFDILPGSFKFLVTAGDRPQPFIQFQALMPHVDSEVVTGRDVTRKVSYKLHTLELFPVSVAGYGYLTPEPDNGQ